jgi:hypothetical protein
MSISFSMSEGRSTLEEMREARLRANGANDRAKRATSAARVEANRRNAQRSTGPRSVEGKRRSARNALKHGLCRTLACLPSECEATFMTFVGELELELRPATPLQRIAFNQIASLTWRLQRLPEAQVRIFEQELAKVEPDDRDERREDGTVQLKPSDVLARRFSDDPAANGFALLERYERGLRSQLLRLMKHYDQLQKHRGTVPYDKDEPPCPDEGKQPAWTEEKARAQREWCAEQERRQRAGEPTDPEWDVLQENLRNAPEQDGVPTPASPPAVAALPGPIEEATHASQLRGETKRTQSKPVENLDSAQRAGKCATSAHAPLTKRTQAKSREAVTPQGIERDAMRERLS